jgi:enamine deaminase RidA (YjgF/YER057c/UK114 family)
MVTRINVPGLVRLPAFCHATRVGDLIFVSGTLGTIDEKGTLAPGGTGPETEQTLRTSRTSRRWACFSPTSRLFPK